MAGLPENLIGTPRAVASAGEPGAGDVLSDVLRSIRLTGSLQFCFMPSGDWETGGKAELGKLAGGGGAVMPFHVVVEGSCWMRMEGREIVLGEGDVVAFPFCTGHQLGVGSGGPTIMPIGDLPPKPWRTLPVLRYGDGPVSVRLLCGYLQCESLSFRPLQSALPTLIHVRTRSSNEAQWLRATIGRMVAEADEPRPGGLSILERLTELVFIELLRHQIIIAADQAATGWLAALADPALGRCLALIHEDSTRDWSVEALASAAGMSRSVLAERFETVLGTSPIRYIREWRLCLASIALGTTERPIAQIAEEAGYGSEAAFNRAFSRHYGIPPAAWRAQNRR